MSDKPPMPVRDSPAPGEAGRPSFLWRPALYPAHYTWYVFLSSLDLLFTWRILVAGGREENALANWILEHHNLPGLIVYKFALVIGVLLICEAVGRRRHFAGVKLARWAVLLSAFPVIVGGVHILRIAMGMHGF